MLGHITQLIYAFVRDCQNDAGSKSLKQQFIIIFSCIGKHV